MTNRNDTDHVLPPQGKNGIVLLHPVQRMHDSDPTAVVNAQSPSEFPSASPSRVLRPILTALGSTELATTSADTLRDLLANMARAATTNVKTPSNPAGSCFTVPAFAELAFTPKATAKTKLYAHLNQWCVALGIKDKEDWGPLGDPSEPLDQNAYLQMMVARVTDELDAAAFSLTQAIPIPYLARTFAKALSSDGEYDHTLISNIVWNFHHLFGRDQQDSTEARCRLAHSLSRVVCQYAANEELTIPSEAQLKDWYKQWTHTRSIDTLLPIMDEDFRPDPAKVNTVMRSMLLLQQPSPPTTPQRSPIPSPRALDPFSSPPRQGDQQEASNEENSLRSPLPTPSEIGRAHV